MSKYSAYSVYKDSGVEWLGEVPEHWEIRKLKFSATLISNKINAKDSELQFIGLENIESFTGKLIFSDTESEGIALYYKDNDILFCKLRPYLAKVYLANQEGLCTSELLVLRGTEIIPPFLKYYLLSQEFINIVDSSTYGSKMPRANWEFIGNLSCLIPHEKEQHQIAAFLDNKTAHLDTLIAKKQQMIGLLNEKRIALITQAVTKGLDLSVPMKGSGIEWLGNVPERWNIRRFRFFLRDSYEGLKIGPFGSQIKSNELTNQGYKIYGQENIINKNFLLGNRFISDDKFNELQVYEIKSNDILITMMGTSGKCEIVPNEIQQGIMDSHLIRIRLNEEILVRFVQILIDQSSYVAYQLNLLGKGSIMHGLNSSVIKNIQLLLPSIDEQQQIIDYLDRETAKIDRMINTIQSAIAKLQEYRSALITAAVTGKIDVRTLTANEG